MKLAQRRQRVGVVSIFVFLFNWLWFVLVLLAGAVVRVHTRLENSTLHNDGIVCSYSSTCKWNKNVKRTMNGHNIHCNNNHREEYMLQEQPKANKVINFDGLDSTYEQCPFCVHFISSGYKKHFIACITKLDGEGNLRDPKWDSAALRMFLNAEAKKATKCGNANAEELFEELKPGGFGLLERIIKNSSVDDRLKKNVTLLGKALKRDANDVKYYLIVSKSLKKAYVGSTRMMMQDRLYLHRSSRSGASTILAADDCKVTVFGMSNLVLSVKEAKSVFQGIEFLVIDNYEGEYVFTNVQRQQCN